MIGVALRVVGARFGPFGVGGSSSATPILSLPGLSGFAAIAPLPESSTDSRSSRQNAPHVPCEQTTVRRLQSMCSSERRADRGAALEELRHAVAGEEVVDDTVDVRVVDALS